MAWSLLLLCNLICAVSNPPVTTMKKTAVLDFPWSALSFVRLRRFERRWRRRTVGAASSFSSSSSSPLSSPLRSSPRPFSSNKNNGFFPWSSLASILNTPHQYRPWIFRRSVLNPRRTIAPIHRGEPWTTRAASSNRGSGNHRGGRNVSTGDDVKRVREVIEMSKRLSREGLWQTALERLDELDLRGGVAGSQQALATAILKLRIEILGDSGRWQQAVRVLNAFGRLGTKPDTGVYTALMAALRTNREWEKVLELFARMPKLGVRRDSEAFMHALRAEQMGGSPVRTLKLADEMRKLGGRFFPVAALQIANNARAEISKSVAQRNEGSKGSQRGPFAAPGAAGDTSQDSPVQIGSSLDETTTISDRKLRAKILWNQILKKGQDGSWQKLLKIWSQMKESGVRADSLGYHRAISTLTMRGRWNEAVTLFREMQSAELAPKVDTLAYIVVALSWIGSGSEAMRLLDEYQVRMGWKASSHGNKPLGGGQSVKEIIEGRVFADVTASTPSFEHEGGQPRAGRSRRGRGGGTEGRRVRSKAMETEGDTLRDWRLVMKAGRGWSASVQMLRSLGSGPEAVPPGAYAAVARECAIGSAWRQALDMLWEARDAGADRGLAPFVEVIDGFASARQVRGAIAAFAAAKRANLRPGVEAYNALLRACGRSRQWVASLRLLERMEVEGVRRNIQSFTLTMQALSSGRQWRRALSLFAEIPRHGLRRDESAFNAAMGACQQGNQQTMEWLRAQMNGEEDAEDDDHMPTPEM